MMTPLTRARENADTDTATRKSQGGTEDPPGTNPRRDAFWHFFVGHHRVLLRFALARMNGNMDEAEDALSTAAINAARAIRPDSAAVENPVAWFFRVLGNCCNDIHRERSRRHQALCSLRPEQRSHLGIDGADSRTPEDTAQSMEHQAEVVQTMTEMPGPLSDALTRRVFNHQDYSEMAAELQISPALARKRVQLARDILRKKVRR